jgi:hypothetical protein
MKTLFFCPYCHRGLVDETRQPPPVYPGDWLLCPSCIKWACVDFGQTLRRVGYDELPGIERSPGMTERAEAWAQVIRILQDKGHA